MKCNQAKEFLSAYIDDMLDQTARNNLKQHLNSCPRCTEEFLTLKKYISDVGSLRPVKAPDDFVEKVNERIKRRFEFEKITRPLLIPAKIKIPLEAAGLVLTVVLVVITYRIIEPGIKYYSAQKDMPLLRDNKQISGIISDAVKEAKPVSAERNIGFIAPERSKTVPRQSPEASQSAETIRQDKRLDSSYEMQSYTIAPEQTEMAAESASIKDRQESREMIAMRTHAKSGSLAKSAGPLAMSGAGKQYDLYVRIMEKDFTLDDALFRTNRIVKSESGIIVFTQTAQDRQSRVAVLNFPAKNYASLINKMKSVGKIHYQPLNFAEDSNELLNLRVHLILHQ